MLAVPTDRFARRRKARVRAGDVLGYASRPSLVVRFELWRLDDNGYAAIDPAELMRRWHVLPWSDAPSADDARPTTHIAA
ncbi:MAG: hypothetical protein NT062_38200 [Proteobacteria bacterium]|nr:hypothetical protein [Pseudomonadota bacterium]